MKNTKKQVSPYAELSAKQLRVLAEQGDAEAQFMLAGRYKKGRGVRESLSKVVEWYTKAAEQGHSGAQNNLGVCYNHGRGVEKDYAKAVEWYTKAAEQGDQEAKEKLLTLKKGN